MNVQRVQMFVCPMRTPMDTSGLDGLIASARVRPETIVALVGKTDGTGLHDDYGRALADLRLRESVAGPLGITRDAVADRIAIILSGGCFGVTTPHVTVITREWVERSDREAAPTGRLVVGTAHSAPILPEDIGRGGQVDKVAHAVSHAMAEAGIHDPQDVHSVMVKAPSLSLAAIRDAESRGQTVVTQDLSTGDQGAISYSNDGSALGVAVALGEVRREDVTDAAIRRNWNLYSAVAATSSGGEKRRAEVLLMGNSVRSASDIRAGHGILRDIIDITGVKDALRSAGLVFDCCPTIDDQRRIVQVFAKLIVPGTDVVRGNRITLLDDHEAYRSSKAVGSALVAAVTGTTTGFVSGGEQNSHQGPPGGCPVAAVVRVAS